jgi:hypothetical protein
MSDLIRERNGAAAHTQVHLPLPAQARTSPRDDAPAPARRPPPWRRRSVQAGAIAALTGIALLVAFVRAMGNASQMGRLRHEVQATHDQATWRCQTLRGARERDDCLAQRTPVPQHNADLRPVP